MGTFYALLVLCAGNSPVSGEFPAQRPVTRSFDVFFVLCLIKRLSKHSRGWLFETPSRPLWRHYNVKDLHTHNSHARVKIGVSFVSSNMVSFTFAIANWTVWKETKFHKLCRAFAFVPHIPQILNIQISIPKMDTTLVIQTLVEIIVCTPHTIYPSF